MICTWPGGKLSLLPEESRRRISGFPGKIERPGGFYSGEPGGGKVWGLTVNDGIDKKTDTVKQNAVL